MNYRHFFPLGHFYFYIADDYLLSCLSLCTEKAECWRTDAFELWCRRLLRVSPLDCKEIQPVHPKGDQSWVFIGRTDVEAETPILWPPDAKSWLTGKDPDAGKDWRQEEKGTTENKMEKSRDITLLTKVRTVIAVTNLDSVLKSRDITLVGWHHRLDGHEFEQVPGGGDGRGSLVCCGPWNCEE